MTVESSAPASGPHTPSVHSAGRQVLELHGSVGGQVPPEPDLVARAVEGRRSRCGTDLPARRWIVRSARTPPSGVRSGRVDAAADGAVAAIDGQPLQVRRHDAGSGRVEDLERAQIDHAHLLPQVEMLGVDDRRPPAAVPLVGAVGDRVALETRSAFARVPLRPFPAARLEELGAEDGRAIVERRPASCRAPTPTARAGARCRRSC